MEKKKENQKNISHPSSRFLGFPMPLVMVGLYLLIAVVWILFAESILSEMIGDTPLSGLINIIRVWFPVVITALLVYLLVKHEIRVFKESQQAIEESERKYRTLLESASEGIAVINESGVIEIVNARTEEIFGYQREELLGENIDILLPEGLREDHTGNHHSYWEKLQPRGLGQARELTARRKDGRNFPVEVSLSSIQTDQGKLILCFIVDITSRKESEKQIRESQRRLATLMSNLPGMVYRCKNRKKCPMEFVSEGSLALTGYPPEAFMKNGTVFYDELIHPDDREVVWKNIRKALRKGVAFQLEYRITDAAGNKKWVWEQGQGIRDDDGKIVAIEGFITDITEHKQAETLAKQQEQQLLQADKMATLGVLVSGVAHEINNPNNYILLNGKILARVWKDIQSILTEYYQKNGDFLMAGMPYSKANEKIGQLIHGITEGAERIQKIVQSLKDFARQDRGDLNQLVDVNKVVESAIIIVQNLIKKSTDQFTVNYGENLPPVKGNFQQLEQVVINLLTNACQALSGNEGGLTIRTEYEASNHRISITVKDEGAGISPENMKHIMDPFFTTKRDRGGTGLGLSISYNIARAHQGDLRLHSEVGKGTTAVLTLPALKPRKHEDVALM